MRMYDGRLYHRYRLTHERVELHVGYCFNTMHKSVYNLDPGPWLIRAAPSCRPIITLSRRQVQRRKLNSLSSAHAFNRLDSKGNYSAASNNMNLVHRPLMGGLLHLVQRGGDWAGPQPAQAPPRCTKCNSPAINGQCTNRRRLLLHNGRSVLMCP